MGLKIDDGGAGTVAEAPAQVSIAGIVSNPREGKESVSGLLDDFYAKLEKQGN